jgi:hypothetical protein
MGHSYPISVCVVQFPLNKIVWSAYAEYSLLRIYNSYLSCLGNCGSTALRKAQQMPDKVEPAIKAQH